MEHERIAAASVGVPVALEPLVLSECCAQAVRAPCPGHTAVVVGVKAVTSSLITLQNRIDTVESKMEFSGLEERFNQLNDRIEAQTYLMEVFQDENRLHQEVIE